MNDQEFEEEFKRVSESIRGVCKIDSIKADTPIYIVYMFGFTVMIVKALLRIARAIEAKK